MLAFIIIMAVVIVVYPIIKILFWWPTPKVLTAEETELKNLKDMKREQKQKRRAQDFEECNKAVPYIAVAMVAIVLAQAFHLYFNTPHQDLAYGFFGLVGFFVFCGLCSLAKQAHINNVKAHS